MLHFAGFSKTQATAALVGGAMISYGLAALAVRAVSRPEAITQCEVTTEYQTPSPVPTPEVPNTLNEVSLQETLDKLGYTVNVPTVYGGHTLLRWNDYRRSTGDDSLSASSFHGEKSSRFYKLSEQAMLAGNLEFGLTDAQGHKRILLTPDHKINASWISAQKGDTCSASLPDSARFILNDTKHVFQTGAFSSVPQANFDQAQHLMTLPARIGGQWVDEGNNTGHWEGGKNTGAILLCWEDWQDFDYQDMVILAENVAPGNSDVKPQSQNAPQ